MRSFEQEKKVAGAAGQGLVTDILHFCIITLRLNNFRPRTAGQHSPRCSEHLLVGAEAPVSHVANRKSFLKRGTRALCRRLSPCDLVSLSPADAAAEPAGEVVVVEAVAP